MNLDIFPIMHEMHIYLVKNVNVCIFSKKKRIIPHRTYHTPTCACDFSVVNFPFICLFCFLLSNLSHLSGKTRAFSVSLPTCTSAPLVVRNGGRPLLAKGAATPQQRRSFASAVGRHTSHNCARGITLHSPHSL